ncbi:dihydrofolate reductase family protein [Microbacterium halotolerans]|uniref:dihydrofolate reductase family protein n=1 Tax=Microbacterium halotolerans TaxID=246613 RepID=UPI000E6AD8AC|nr:dihydrofolate reductase family protein [Microbacterium halotolerans]
MRKLVYYVGVTLDGCIAGPQGETDIFPVTEELISWIIAHYPETLPTHIRHQLDIDDKENRAFDTVVMGRRTFEPALAVPTTSPYAHLHQHVISRTLKLEDAAVNIDRGDPVDLVRRLKRQPSDKNIWLCGGGSLAGSLLSEIDEIVLKRYPVVAGEGIRLFASEFDPRRFIAADRHEFADGTSATQLVRS